ncbi:FAD-dependent oxidoreductase [Hamadaea sp. NPDC051192]|uniref:FAD-dependent oxidoreductase n=1 Tax=Hamadaea sp. NPDC051192 TaxID=3154940 RepID=UPI0034170C41
MTSGYRIAVVGGGIFGVTAAVHLARAGHTVELFEAAPDLLCGASSVNQRRLHHGYHYPRSSETVAAVRQGVRSFREEYPDSVRGDHEHYVAIASEGSLVSAEQYLQFCDRSGLPYREEFPPFLRRSSVDLALRVQEEAVDIAALRRSCWRKLTMAGVDVHLRSPQSFDDLKDFDRVVMATYARLNDLESSARAGTPSYQYEVCEKPVVRLPDQYRGRSIVILDGPFMCVDPYDRSGMFVLGNVVHAVHLTAVGRFPLVPVELADKLNGRIQHTRHTRFAQFVDHARPFLADIDQAQHMGSLFTIRAVLPHVEHTDARPTLVRRIDERVISIFSGKIATCVEAARDVTAMCAQVSAPPGADTPEVDAIGQTWRAAT